MANRISWSSSDCDIRYPADLWIEIRRTGIFEAPTGIQSAFVINVINGKYVIFQRPRVCCEIIIEEINSNSFQEFYDTDKLFVVVPLNPTEKKFPTISNCYPHSNISTKL